MAIGVLAAAGLTAYAAACERMGPASAGGPGRAPAPASGSARAPHLHESHMGDLRFLFDAALQPLRLLDDACRPTVVLDLSQFNRALAEPSLRAFEALMYRVLACPSVTDGAASARSRPHTHTLQARLCVIGPHAHTG